MMIMSPVGFKTGRDDDNFGETSSKRVKNVKHTISSIMPILNRLVETVDKIDKQQECLNEMPIIHNKLDSFCADITEMKTGIRQLDNKTTTLEQKTLTLEVKNAELEKSLVNLTKKINELASTSQTSTTSTKNDLEILKAATNMNAIGLDRIVNKQEQRNEAVISSFPDGEYLNEHYNIVMTILGRLNFAHTEAEITGTRLLKKNELTNPGAASNNNSNSSP